MVLAMTTEAERPDYYSAPRLVLRYGTQQRGRLIFAAILGVVAGIMGLAPAWAVWAVVSALIREDLQAHLVWQAAAIALVGVLGKQLLFGLSTRAAHFAAFEIIAEIRMALGRAWVHTRVGQLRAGHSSTARTTAIDHCEKLELFIAHAIPEITASLTVWVTVTLWLFWVDWRLALATIVMTPLGFWLMIHAMRANGYRMGEWMAANGGMGAAIIDFLSAMPVIRVFNRVGEDHRRTTDAVRLNAELQSQWGKAFVPLGSPFSTLTASAIAVIAPLAAWLLYVGAVDAQTVVLFLILGPSYSQPLVGIYGLLTQIPLLSAGAVMIEAELARKTCEENPAGVLDKAPEIVCEHLSFSYPGASEPALDDVSVSLPAGKVTAIVGASGSGKSTFAEILLGFHEPSHGRILVDGEEGVVLRDSTAAVFQQPYLLAGTVGENLTLADPEASQDVVDRALVDAAVSEFFGDLDAGMDTVLGESGAGVSGGQKQRVAIARAFIADRPVLVLDEATAATDPDNEALIQEGLSRLVRGRTTVIIAHRLHTIKDAAQIVVLDRGRVVEVGDHESLMAQGGAYAGLWASLSEVN